MSRLTPDQLNALKDRNPCDAVAGQWVKLRRKGGRKGSSVGPCPMCSDDPQSKSSTRFECDADKWVCAVCQDGGDVIRLIEKREGISFVAAVERLGGAREESITPAVAERRGQQDFKAGVAGDDPLNVPPAYDADPRLIEAWHRGWRKANAAEATAARYRTRERERLYGFWRAGSRLAGTMVASYHATRGIVAPENARLKYHPDMISFADGREVEPTIAHRGPAQLAAIIGPDGKFAGLHTTWIDLAGPKGKAEIVHPETGEVLPSKKVRGTKAGGYIDLGGCDAATARRMIAGEGVETVLAVYTALVRAGRDVSDTAFRCSVDLGNLAGRATSTLAHPCLKSPAGRAQRVPGPDPDMTSPAMPVPDTITELVLLGDGDSDPFLTRNALTRAKARHAREDRAVRVRFAPDGLDFNDMINRPAKGEEIQDTDDNE